MRKRRAYDPNYPSPRPNIQQANLSLTQPAGRMLHPLDPTDQMDVAFS
jgi:hypothetical protein